MGKKKKILSKFTKCNEKPQNRQVLLSRYLNG